MIELWFGRHTSREPDRDLFGYLLITIRSFETKPTDLGFELITFSIPGR